jgi:hypothetical protein
MVPAEEMRTTLASCSTALTLLLGDTVTSALCVTNDLGLKGWTVLPLAVESTELHVDSVFLERPVRPENIDPDTATCQNLISSLWANMPSDGVERSSERNEPVKNPLAGNRVLVVVPESSWDDVSEVTV